MKLQGFIGPAYSLNSVNVDSQRCVNLYPEIIESRTGKEAQVAYLKNTPGLQNVIEVGSGPIRCVHRDTRGQILVVSGNELFRLSESGGVWSSTDLSDGTAALMNFTTSTGPVRASSIYQAGGYGYNYTVFLDGSTSYLYRRYAIAEVDIEKFRTYSVAEATEVTGASDITWIDGYLIITKADSNQYFVSTLDSVNFDDGLGFASAEGDPDNNVGCIANNRDLWIFGEKTTEVFVNTGNSDFPFERVQGGFIEQGCASQGSIAKINGSVFWLGQDEFGRGSVFIGHGLSYKRISTHAIEESISSYADVSSSEAYTYSSNGHYFYVINFAEATWVYDLSTGLWHERAYTADDGTLERQRGEYHTYDPVSGSHLVGDYTNNKIYVYDDDYYKDDTQQITRLRTSPHLSAGGLRLFCSRLQLDMETGVGLDGGIQGSEPEIMLSYSDDGGHTWSDELWASIDVNVGGIGDFKKRVIWNRLGSFRDRIFKVKITDPVKVIFLSAELKIKAGSS